MEIGKKIEIITNTLELKQVVKILEEVGVSGYSIIQNVVGKGDRGKVINDLETNVLTNGYVMSICTEAQAQQLVAGIKPILRKFGGTCVVSDAQWIDH